MNTHETRMPESDEAVRETVRSSYAQVARGDGGCCGGESARQTAERIGYGATEFDMGPDGASLGLGCANPTALAALSPGEVVVELGARGDPGAEGGRA